MSTQNTKTYLIPGATIHPNMQVMNPQADKKPAGYQQALDRQMAELLAADSRITK